MNGWPKYLTRAAIILFVIVLLIFLCTPFSPVGYVHPTPRVEESLKHASGAKRPAPDGNVIFVHGLGGDAVSTWENPKTSFSFVRAFGNDLPNVGIWSVNYDASSSKLKGSPLPIPDRSRVLLEQIKQYDLHKNNLILVGHSLGGLIIKQMLRDASDSSDPSSRAVVERTRGVIFLATPHTGGGDSLIAFADSLSALSQPTDLL